VVPLHKKRARGVPRARRRLDAVRDKTDPVTCALVLSDNPQAVEVLRLFKPDRVFLAYEGRKLLKALKEFNVAVCTYLPFNAPRGIKTTDLPILLRDVPRGATAGLSLSATPRSTKITVGSHAMGASNLLTTSTLSTSTT